MERIREIVSELKEKGYTQISLANELGRDQGTISKWLNGRLEVPESIAMLIESKFGYRKEWILNGELPKKVDQKAILSEVARIAKQGRDLDQLPEIRDLIPKILKLKEDEYQMLVNVMNKFLK